MSFYIESRGVAPLPLPLDRCEKVQVVVRFDEAVQPFDDCLIHLLNRVERSITIPNDVLVPAVKIGSEPDAGCIGILTSAWQRREESVLGSKSASP
jgi:hypothetical protein